MPREPQYPHQPKRKTPLFPHVPKGQTICKFTITKGHRDIIITRVPRDPARILHITTRADRELVLGALTERERRGLEHGLHVEIREDEPRAATLRQLWENSVQAEPFSPQAVPDVEPVPARYSHLGDWFDMPQTMMGAEPVPRRLQHLITWVDEPLPDIAFVPAVEASPGEGKVEALLKKLEAGVEAIHESDNFRLFLTTMSRFRDYSFGNQILIMLQRPGATHVAGFVAWKELGRWVKKGEAGIGILAPVFLPRQECTQCGAKIPKGSRFCPGCGAEADKDPDIASPRYFRTVYVFDISQTQGEPLPEFDVPTLTGAMNTDLWNKTLGLMQKQGVTVTFHPQPHQSPSIKGYYRQPAEIWVRPEEPPAQQLKTLLHEAAHHYSASVFRIPRADAETIAESAAYVIGAHYGFDTGVRSFPYVALWSRDKKVLKANLKSIQDVSTRILEGLEGG